MVVVFVLFLVLLGFFNSVFFYFVGFPFSPVVMTGYVASSAGLVNVLIEIPTIITIHSPENITYTFNKGDIYIVALNVSADFEVNDSTGWKYSLYDITHEVYTEENTSFVPNSSIVGVRWGNLLTVFAYWEDNYWVSEVVVFSVNVSNSDPILGDIDEPILVCEGENLDYRFNATDVDEEDLTGDVTPKNPFYLNDLGMSGTNMSLFAIISGVLRKVSVGNHAETISVVDPYDGVDSVVANISVIEINNPPTIVDVGAQTVWLEGDNSTFYYVANVSDEESSSFSFNLTWGSGENLFDINSSTGVINYTPVVGHEGKVYSLTVCASDDALSSVHENISVCSPRDGDVESVCDSFSLTVTEDNRAPVISNYVPSGNFSVGGTTTSDFYVEVSDPDGTIPDIDWYIDEVLQEHNENVSSDTFSHAFGCGVSGIYNVTIITTDGLLNSSVSWEVSVGLVACPVAVAGGATSGSGASFCFEDWACDDWEVCQNVKRSFDANVFSLEEYTSMKEICAQEGYGDDAFCGFQITACLDLRDCNNTKLKVERPSEQRICYFTENPNCHDGISNCHDGSCELLIDCGGPCGLCATCSDGKQNQGEFGIDCGGPCPYLCELEEPSDFYANALIVLLAVLVLVILYMICRLFILFFKRKKKKVKS